MIDVYKSVWTVYFVNQVRSCPKRKASSQVAGKRLAAIGGSLNELDSNNKSLKVVTWVSFQHDPSGMN